MSGRSSEYAMAHLEELIEAYDGDYYRALAEFEGLDDDTKWSYLLYFSDYKISSDGRVQSLKGKESIELKPWHSSYGYPYVSMTDDFGVRHKKTVHSMVAELFCDNPDPKNYNVVRHIDDDPTNNNYWNLKWGTQAMNHQDMVDHDRDFKKACYCYELDRTFRSCAEAADYFGLSRSTITQACRDGAKLKNGYHLCFETDKEKKLANLDTWLDDSKSHNYRKVKAINLETEENYIFDSRQQASKALGVHDTAISNILAGRFHQSKGWTFEDMYEGG